MILRSEKESQTLTASHLHILENQCVSYYFVLTCWPHAKDTVKDATKKICSHAFGERVCLFVSTYLFAQLMK